MNNSENGNGNIKSTADLQEQKIDFPVTFKLKAVMVGSESDEDNKQKLTNVFTSNIVDYKFLDKKVSSKGSYASFSFEVTLNSREQMNKLYEDLKKIKELKFAV